MGAIPLRVIDLSGTCRRSGDCCSRAGTVVMTPAERDEILGRRPDLAPRFGPWTPGFVGLAAAGGCPLLTIAEGLASCSVHDIRPTNCRRFWCGRPDPAIEPFEDDVRPVAVMGCKNLTDRVLQSRPFRRLMAQRQRKVMRTWGHRHGWREGMPGDLPGAAK